MGFILLASLASLPVILAAPQLSITITTTGSSSSTPLRPTGTSSYSYSSPSSPFSTHSPSYTYSTSSQSSSGSSSFTTSQLSTSSISFSRSLTATSTYSSSHLTTSSSQFSPATSASSSSAVTTKSPSTSTRHSTSPLTWLNGTAASRTVAATSSSPACPTIQYSFSDQADSKSLQRAQAVKDAYQVAWLQYEKKCFGHDSSNVGDGACSDEENGWGATIFDALDTAIIMNLTDIASRQLQYIALKSDFDRPGWDADPVISGFETTIRYLGGLLSAYDLLNSDVVQPGIYEQDHIDALLSQAVALAMKLKPLFLTESGVPASGLNLLTQRRHESSFENPLDGLTYKTTSTAEAGTILLEYYRLSDLSKLNFRDQADRSEKSLLSVRPIAEGGQGVPGTRVDLETGQFLTNSTSWGAGEDSFLEYLIKAYIYDSGENSDYLDAWIDAVSFARYRLAESPFEWPELLFLSQLDTYGNKTHSMVNYACFAGGNILYGSTFALQESGSLSASQITDFSAFGLSLIESCYHLYNTTSTGLAPSGWSWFASEEHTYNLSLPIDPGWETSHDRRGYFITSPGYGAFPEAVESIWYAYRITGDPQYQDWNWQIFQSLLAQSDKPEERMYGSVSDVDKEFSVDGGIPSFFFAELSKYMYLSFSDPELLSLDEWVFSTEGHPLKIAGGCERTI